MYFTIQKVILTVFEQLLKMIKWPPNITILSNICCTLDISTISLTHQSQGWRGWGWCQCVCSVAMTTATWRPNRLTYTHTHSRTCVVKYWDMWKHMIGSATRVGVESTSLYCAPLKSSFYLSGHYWPGYVRVFSYWLYITTKCVKNIDIN